MTQNGNILSGSRYPWTAEIVGDDLVIRGQHATWFGGSDDPLDDGQTASGISTKSNPNYLGCALPMDYGPTEKHNPCAGSPLPRLPWGTNVEFTNPDNGIIEVGKLIDIGPSAPPVATAAADLTQPLFKLLGGNLGVGRINVDVRVIGGAKLCGLCGSPDPLQVATTAPPPPDSGLTVTPDYGIPIS